MPRPILLSISLSLVVLTASSRGDGYHWPLDAPRALTSTFAEHRSGHLHAGIDLKTWGQVGCGVHAVGDGYVWRVRTSPWNYGKALYLRLQDGKTAVYAHLSDFAIPIREIVEGEQARQGRYSVDLALEPDEIPVREGELVGFSGRTGCDHPHLHFELRDEENCPVNPLSHGFSVADHRAPLPVSLSITPLDWRSAVDGQLGSQLYPLRWNAKERQYRLTSIPHVEGRVVLALAVHDLADGAENRLNVYALHLFVDERRIFSAAYDRFSFSSTDKVNLETDYDLFRRGRGIYHNLYVAQGNDLPFYGIQELNSGVIDARILKPGQHQVRIRAEDHYGNTSQVEFFLLLDNRPQLEDVHIYRDSISLHMEVRATDPDGPIQRVLVEVSEDLGGRWEPLKAVSVPGQEDVYRARRMDPGDSVLLIRTWAEDQFGVRSHPRIGSAGVLPREDGEPKFGWNLTFYHNFAEIFIRSDRLLAQEPKVMINQMGEEPRLVPVHLEGPYQYRGLAPLLPGMDGDAVVSIVGRDLSGRLGAAGFSFPVNTVTKKGGGRLGDIQEGIEVVFQPGCVYQTFVGRVEEMTIGSQPGLSMRSKAFFLYPDDIVFDGRATVFLAPPEGQEQNERIGVYRLSRDGEWCFAGRIVERTGGAVGAQVKSLSTFALLEDQIAPLIWRVRPKNGLQTRQQRPVLSARIRDKGSGIGREEDVMLVLDGQTVISQYDPPVEAVSYRPQKPLALGEHLLEVIVRDRAGNESRAQSRFTIIP